MGKEVFSDALMWLPAGSEIPSETRCRFNSPQNDMKTPIRPVETDVLLAMLAPGQEIVLEAHCTKGIGREHAKWSPVATVWYRLRPEVMLLQEVVGDMADRLASLLPGFVTVKGF